MFPRPLPFAAARAPIARLLPGTTLPLRTFATITRRPGASVLLQEAAPPAPSTPSVDFDDAEGSFRDKSVWELARGLLVFQLSSIKPLIQHSSQIMETCDKILPKCVVDCGLKATFFGHFCAGEDGESIRPVVAKLKRANIGSILDYAAEADVGASKRTDIDVDRNVLQSRTYDYSGEEECDMNTEITLKAIDAAKETRGFAAVKHLSLIIKETQRQFLGFNSYDDVSRGTAASDTNKLTFNLPDFVKYAQHLKLDFSEEEIERMFKAVDVDGSGEVDVLDWLDYVEPQRLCSVPVSDPRWSLLLTPGSENTMSPRETQQFAAMLRRLDTLATAARDAGVTLMVDAEQTYLQPAIDHCVQYLQQRYNADRPVVYNTIQAYLTDSMTRLELGLRRARRHGVKYGVKLVRGAYMVQESALAAEKGNPSPIWPNIQATHDNYNACIRLLLDSLPAAEFMVASHNEDSIRFVISEMQKRGVDPQRGGVSFGQLLGMCDHVSFPLGRAGYRAYKYVPYGPIREVMPYLIRRAQENSDILGRVGKERRMLTQALVKRLAP